MLPEGSVSEDFYEEGYILMDILYGIGLVYAALTVWEAVRVLSGRYTK